MIVQRSGGRRGWRAEVARLVAIVAAYAVVVMGVAAVTAGVAGAANCHLDHTGLIPMIDLTGGTYAADGVEVNGGLYPDGTNTPPAGYAARGVAAGEAVEPLDASGQPDPTGRVGFVGIGGSVARYELDGFIDLAANALDPSIVMVNAALGGRDLEHWRDPAGTTWRAADARVADAGLTNAQVRVVWMKNSLKSPRDRSFPDWVAANEAATHTVIENIVARYPNLQQIFLSSRSYGNYLVNENRTIEPWAYEHGYAVREVVAQSTIDPPAPWPWVGWGPYLWADGVTPRSDGFTWTCADMEEGGGHPSPQGVAKMAALLDGHFTASPYSPWFTRATGAAIDSITPSWLLRGTIDQAITVEGHGFAPGASLSLGEGVTVVPGSVSDSVIEATASVGDDADAGVRDVTVTNPDGVEAVCAGCLSIVTSPPPTVTDVAPPTLPPGAARAEVSVHGSGFAEGSSVTMGSRVKVHAVRFVDSTELALVVSVFATATPGPRTVTVTIPSGETATCACFGVS